MECLIVYEILYSFGEQLIDSLLKRTPKFIRPPLVSILNTQIVTLSSLLPVATACYHRDIIAQRMDRLMLIWGNADGNSGHITADSLHHTGGRLIVCIQTTLSTVCPYL